MAFFTSALDTLKVLVIALGAGLGVWGVINLLEGDGNDNPGAKSQGMKHDMLSGEVTHDAHQGERNAEGNAWAGTAFGKSGK